MFAKFHLCALPPPPSSWRNYQKTRPFFFSNSLTQHSLSIRPTRKRTRAHKKRERERSEKESSALQRSRISSLLIYFPFHSLELILILCHNPGWLLFLRSALCVQKLCVVWIILNMCAFISRERARV
jgi:hypothetical protein